MNSPEQELIPLSSKERWSSRLNEIPHHFSHTWAHCQAMFMSTGYPTYLYSFRLDQKLVLCPFCERTYQGFTDIVTPYGFNGFIANGDCPEFSGYWNSFVRNKGYVCGYFGLNPLLQNELGFAENEKQVYHEIYALNLTRNRKELIGGMSENRKRQLKKMDEMGSSLTHDKAVLTTFFLNHYDDFIQKKAASRIYHFSKVALKMLVEQDNVFMTGYIENESVMAVSVFGYTAYAADFLFSVNTEMGKDSSFAIMWLGIEKLLTMGVPVLNLGGGVKTGDTLSDFKKRFGGDVRELVCVRQVYEPLIFQNLCIEAGVDIQDAGYFPPYRTKTHS